MRLLLIVVLLLFHLFAGPCVGRRRPEPRLRIRIDDEPMCRNVEQIRIRTSSDSVQSNSHRMAGLVNPGNACFFSTGLRPLYLIDDFYQAVFFYDEAKIDDRQTRRLFKTLRDVMVWMAIIAVASDETATYADGLFPLFPLLGLTPGDSADVTYALDALVERLPEEIQKI